MKITKLKIIRHEFLHMIIYQVLVCLQYKCYSAMKLNEHM